MQVENRTVVGSIHFRTASHGARKLSRGPKHNPPEAPQGRIPRITKLMALAVKFEELLATGEISDYAELARLGNVTRARITQIMNLRLLAPEIQEKILFCDRIHTTNDPIQLCDLQPIALEPDWGRQRGMVGGMFG